MKSRKILVRNVLEKHAGVARDACRQDGEHFYEMLQPNILGDFAAENRSV